MDAATANRLRAGVTKKGEGLDGVTWNILGQAYIPKLLSENSLV
jgi:hypothetical protein